MKTYSFDLQYRSATGATRSYAKATGVRATPTLFVVEPRNVQVLDGKAQFGGLRKYKRDTLAPYPKRRFCTGNGYWKIIAGSVIEDENVLDKA